MQKLPLLMLTLLMCCCLHNTAIAKTSVIDNTSVSNYFEQRFSPTPTPPYQLTQLMWNIFKFDDFDSLWKKHQELENQGLTEDAKKIVLQIRQKAQAEGNHPQFVKAILHQYRYMQYNEENSTKKIVADLKANIETAPAPLKNILQSILADNYWNYFNSNRYNILQRTFVADTVEDFETWDAGRFANTVNELHQQSVMPAQMLQQIPITNYDLIIEGGDAQSPLIRPSLYDFLAHRAISFFRDSQSNLTKAAEQFQFDDPKYFAPAKAFAQLKTPTDKAANTLTYAFELYQQLTQFHLNTANTKADALIMLELERLDFVHQNANIDNKDELRYNAFVALEKQYPNAPATAHSMYLRAQIHQERSGSYHAYEHPQNKDELKIAIDIAQQIVARFPQTTTASNAKALIEQIKNKHIELQTEQSALPQQAFRALVRYKNVDKIYLRIVAIDEALNQYLATPNNREQKDYIDHIARQKPLWEGQYELPNPKDYQQHSTEVKIDALPIGQYLLVGSTSPKFTYAKEATGYTRLQITELSLLNSTDQNTAHCYVLHRNTGQAMPNINYEIYEIRYEYANYEQKTIRTQIHKGTTDQEGYFNYTFPSADNYRGSGYEVVLMKGNDRISTPIGAYYYPSSNPSQTNTFFFTDRSIYRPGQTLYFKGIMLQRGTDNTLLSQQETTVKLYDVNGQEIGKQTLKTNEFGSFNGKFTLPTNLLNGQMQLTNDIGYAYFSVEEYKRPKFEAKMHPIEGSFRLNETITAQGTATAYAGNAIGNAKVSYRVVRKANFPYWCYWWRPAPTLPDVEITNGTTTTDQSGNFTINFKAIPERNSNPKDQAQYNYQIIADVTDLNGETQSTQTSVAVSYTALLISAPIPADIDQANKIAFPLSTTNLNGQKVATAVELTVYELQQPDRLLRSRLWERPDQFVMTQAAYYAAFPNDIYNNEDDMATWKTKEVYRKTLQTPADSNLQLAPMQQLAVGKYLIKLTAKDAFGETVTAQHYVTLYNTQSKSIPTNTAFWSLQQPNTVEPNQQTHLIAGSRLPNARMLYIVEHQHRIVQRKWIDIAQLQTQISETIREEHRGGFLIRVAHASLNRTHEAQYAIQVPWSNKELKVSLSTFRNKMLPGSEQTWQIHITGSKGEKVAAELLANMYDAALDAFRPHQWQTPDLYPTAYYSQNQLGFGTLYGIENLYFYSEQWNNQVYFSSDNPNYPTLNNFGFALYSENGGGRHYMMRGGRGIQYDAMTMSAPPPTAAPKAVMAEKLSMNDEAQEERIQKKDSNKGEEQQTSADKPKPVQIRKNLQETAFFFPELRTNSAGDIVLSFTAPEALTRWNLMLFAHTRNLQFGQEAAEVQTQKELMVQPNPPRFLRQGDEMYFATKIANLSEQNLQGKATLKLFDALTGKAVESAFELEQTQQNFAVDAKQSTALSWKIKVPSELQAITYQVIAETKDFSDGEENALPILTNRMLVTESLPLPMRGIGTKNFSFDKLQQSQQSNTLQHQSLSLEYTAQPAWYAIQALPYLMEYPQECSEQIFSRYYANSIGSHIANSDPRVKTVFEQWQAAAIEQDKSNNPNKQGALFSNLEKNQELKYLLLQETPWVMDAQNEKERKRRVATLFDLSRMIAEQQKAEQELIARQNGDGSFAWFNGMLPNRYITQHIATGFGHLDQLGVKALRDNPNVWQMVQKAVGYVDHEADKYYRELKTKKLLDKDGMQYNYNDIHYLYMRSFFPDIPLNPSYQESFAYWKKQAEQHWLQQNRYMQAMTALALYRLDKDNATTAQAIMESLRQNATNNEEMGMYFKQNTHGWYWYEAPIEEQALMIEAFHEVAKDETSVEALKVWLLKQKQTQDWKTTRATAEACYALLLTGDNWLQQSPDIDITVGKQHLNPNMPELKAEAGTGYFKTNWQAAQIQSNMGNISITKKDKGVSWGAMYWQYFEQLDKITFAETPLKIKKQLFLQNNTQTGVQLTPINDKSRLKVGDLVTVRVEIRVDRAMEYVHLKDMRAAGFEPVNVISQYKYQDGLGYYETTKDAATNFFMDYLPKGTYVFEYPLRASQKGNFSNGITTMQCMYAPEFTSHSEGIRVQIGE